MNLNKLFRQNKKGLVLMTSLALALISCKKDEDTPGINISHPTPKQEISIGETIHLEGLAVDDLELKEVRFKIETPYANYNFELEGTIPVSGANAIFKHDVSLPYDGPIGGGVISFYSVDLEDKTSDVVYQDLLFVDNIYPNIEFHTPDGTKQVSSYSFGTLGNVKTHYKHGKIESINNLDSLEFTFFKNEHGIFDSVSVYNITSDELLLTGKEYGGGFNQLVLYRGSTVFPDPGRYLLEFLVESDEDIYRIGHQVHLTPGEAYDEEYKGTLEITFTEKPWGRQNKVNILAVEP